METVLYAVGQAITGTAGALAEGATALIGGSGAPLNLLAAGGQGVGLGSTALSVLQGAAGLGSMFAAINKGNAEADNLNLQATQAEAEARQTQMDSLQRTAAMKRELARVLGENDVAFAAGGVDLGAGVAADAAATAKQRAADEITIDRSVADARMALQVARAGTYRRLASQASDSGWLNAGTIGLSTLAGIAKRG